MNSLLRDTDPFSGAAKGYDASFTRLHSTVLIRERIHVLVQRYFPRDAAVLDLACGTGEDAAILAQGAYRVVGMDRSYAMLSQAAAKTCSMVERTSFVQGDAASLCMFRDAAFDAIISNFGGLNCVPDLRTTLAECHRVLRPDGMMILCLLGAHPAWENLAFALRGAWGSMFRRHSGTPVSVRVGAHTVDTWYYSVGSLRRVVGGMFEIVRIAGLNVVAPPPSSQDFVKRHPKLTSLLFSLDHLIQSLPLLQALGDHVVLVLRRRPVP